jgi:hypothetical protein
VSYECWFSATGGCSPAVAANTDDFAESDLSVEPREADALVREYRHCGGLLLEMIQLQDQRIALPAVRAGMRSEVAQHVSLGAKPPSAERFSRL